MYTQFELSNNPFVWYSKKRNEGRPLLEVKMKYTRKGVRTVSNRKLRKDYNYRYIQLVKNLKKKNEESIRKAFKSILPESEKKKANKMRRFGDLCSQMAGTIFNPRWKQRGRL